MMTLYFAPGASSMAAHIALYEVGAAFEAVPLSFKRRENRTAAYLALNAEGKVPTLVIEGRPLTEVAAILFYLARTFPDAKLLPPDPEAQAQVVSWMSFAAATLHPARRRGLDHACEVCGLADARLGARAWAVEVYTIADIHLFRLYWRLRASLRPRAGTFPNLEAHHERMMQRAAVRRVIEMESAMGMNFPPEPHPAQPMPVKMQKVAGSAGEVFLVFLKLGLTSFGGPIAHLGYFRAEFVERRHWLSEPVFSDLVALAQFLPGPASSQTGFAIGVMRAGLWGGAAAWLGFTLPSAILMLLFAAGAPDLAKAAWGAGVLHGLKLLAVAVVGQAVLGMARSLCPDRLRAAIAVLALAAVVALPGSRGQIGAILVGGLIGLAFCRGRPAADATDFREPLARRFGLASLAIFAMLLVLSFLPAGLTLAGLTEAFYRSGALVFGGGHVVLPLLHDAVVVPGFVSDTAFLAGYGAAQALPGPVFTVAAYLGAVAALPSSATVGALAALVAIFLPGLLALVGVLPFWQALRAAPRAQAAMAGLNAAVVGLLAAALYDPVWTGAVHQPRDFAFAVAAFVALVAGRVPVLAVVAFCAGAGAVFG